MKKLSVLLVILILFEIQIAIAFVFCVPVIIFHLFDQEEEIT